MPRARKRRAVDFDEYVAETIPNPQSDSLVHHHHSEYEMSGPPVQSSITVPVSVNADEPPNERHRNLGDRTNEDDFTIFEEDDRELEAMGLSSEQKKTRYGKDNPLLAWVPHIDTYVDEMLRMEGPANTIYSCANPDCVSALVLLDDMDDMSYQCKDCLDVRLFCRECILLNHRSLPLHRIKMWNGTFFERIALKALGLRIQLGHPDTNSCPVPDRCFNDDFTIIDANGIHQVNLDFCGCEIALPKTIQLLRARLFPSTVIEPRTAATFGVLKTFQMLSFTSKISNFEFYRALARRTDNLGIRPPPDRYHAFLRIVREWRHVRLLKRKGRGHAESGVEGTEEGECAVLCPACPLPGINLPPDWKQRPNQWLYALFIGIDANFRLKRLNVSSDVRDPGLNHGYAYVVENKAFRQYLSDFGEKIIEAEKTTCRNHDAVKSANMRGKKGTAATGMGTVDCSRHDMKRPTSVGELQKGERYVNMDYFLLCSLRKYVPTHLVASYDIICQWARHLLDRAAVYPPNALTTMDLIITYLIPKFHLPAHIPACQIDYSFNLVPRVGRTDGEAPERGWSNTNGIASSTKEMGPGSYHDTVDDHLGDYNWKKIAQIGNNFVRKAEEAIKCRAEFVEAFIEFDAALPANLTIAWTKLCQDWERDTTTKSKRKKNPFYNPVKVISDTEVRMRLAQADKADLAAGRQSVVHNDVTPSMLVNQGIDIEEAQIRHRYEVSQLGSHSTSLQKAKVLEHANSLTRKTEAWIELQHLYFPRLPAHRAKIDEEGVGDEPPAIQDIPLYLPSELRLVMTCERNFLTIEFQFRHALAHSTISELRSQLIMRSMMWKSKERLSRGQQMQTRSLSLIANVQRRIDACADRYRRHRKAMESLTTVLLDKSWMKVLLVLQKEDMEGLTSLDSDEAEGRKKLTWIWNVAGFDPGDRASTHSALRIEWCKARARAHRWQEECLLLHEEMRRVVSFFEWEANHWHQLAEQYQKDPVSSYTDPVLAAMDISTKRILYLGKVSYAYQQAKSRLDIKEYCQVLWANLTPSLIEMVGRNANVMVECH